VVINLFNFLGTINLLHFTPLFVFTSSRYHGANVNVNVSHTDEKISECIKIKLAVLTYLFFMVTPQYQTDDICLVSDILSRPVCFCMFLVGYPQMPEPVIPLVDWQKLTYLVLMCRKTPINQSIILLLHHFNHFVTTSGLSSIFRFLQFIFLFMFSISRPCSYCLLKLL